MLTLIKCTKQLEKYIYAFNIEEQGETNHAQRLSMPKGDNPYNDLS